MMKSCFKNAENAMLLFCDENYITLNTHTLAKSFAHFDLHSFLIATSVLVDVSLKNIFNQFHGTCSARIFIQRIWLASINFGFDIHILRPHNRIMDGISSYLQERIFLVTKALVLSRIFSTFNIRCCYDTDFKMNKMKLKTTFKCGSLQLVLSLMD